MYLHSDGHSNHCCHRIVERERGRVSAVGTPTDRTPLLGRDRSIVIDVDYGTGGAISESPRGE